MCYNIYEVIDMEKWVDVKDYEGLYKVSNRGRVKSLGRYQQNYSKKQWRPEEIKSARTDPQGYKMMDLYKNGKQKTVRVHRLVALAFIPNPENKPTVNHIDGDRNNNAVENLEWATFEEQNRHFYQRGLKSEKNIKKAVKAMNKASSVAVECITDNKVFKSQSEAARHYGIDPSSISMAINGKRKSAGKNKQGDKLKWRLA